MSVLSVLNDEMREWEACGQSTKMVKIQAKWLEICDYVIYVVRESWFLVWKFWGKF